MNYQQFLKQSFAGLAVSGFAFSLPVMADEEGDGAPHVAIVEDAGDLEIEFEVDFGLDLSTTPPTINLVAPTYDNTYLGYRTFAVNDTPIPNDDLGFVSEVEGQEEGGAIAGNIVVRMLSKDDNFSAFDDITPIFTDGSPDRALGSAFDFHPIWVLANTEGDLTPASASFEVFDVTGGGIGSGAVSLGTFDVTIAVPEPSSLALLAGAGLLIARRRRA